MTTGCNWFSADGTTLKWYINKNQASSSGEGDEIEPKRRVSQLEFNYIPVVGARALPVCSSLSLVFAPLRGGLLYFTWVNLAAPPKRLTRRRRRAGSMCVDVLVGGGVLSESVSHSSCPAFTVSWIVIRHWVSSRRAVPFGVAAAAAAAHRVISANWISIANSESKVKVQWPSGKFRSKSEQHTRRQRIYRVGREEERDREDSECRQLGLVC